MSVQSITSPHEPSRIGIAFAAALLLHGTALAALTLWPSKESVAPPGEQEITIDLAPALEEAVSVAPAEVAAVESLPVEAEPLPVEPETVEALPPEDAVEDQPEEVTNLEEPVTEAEPVEAVQAEPAAPEVQAVVAVPPPETVVARPVEEKAAPKPEKKPPPKPAERKPAPRRTVAERPTPPSNATRGQASSSREDMGGSAASADPAARNRYLASLAAALQRRLRYPDAARAQGISGVAQIRFTVDRSGRVVGASLVRSAGHPALDQAALATAAPGSSVPPVPDFIPQLTYTIPLRFNLR
ncbi:energy transducer TonB [Microvirga splendida]|uniref:Protein TonB n=1 Tax=Microvirga splendida TaxID=2795727 RepID=A0ABS0XUZ1_9HYPH|nr:energy transducer TonB [Microvirga splendida]MBJ6123866.1 energy transducer TonB [Microvirga splendida]